jgi:hypothetical protein
MFFLFIFTRGYNFGAIVDLGVRQHQKIENPGIRMIPISIDEQGLKIQGEGVAQIFAKIPVSV